jgi:L,D-transpeptidase catalytic domain
MRRLAFPVLFLLGLFAAGALSASVVASTLTTTTATTTASTDTTGTTETTETTDTTITTTTTTTTTTRKPRTIAPGVTVGGVSVGGMRRLAAKKKVRRAFLTPLRIRVAKTRYRVAPARLGALPHLRRAMGEAMRAAAGTAVPLDVTVQLKKTRSYVIWLARRSRRDPRDARFAGLRNLRPYIARERPGRELRTTLAIQTISRTLKANLRGPVRLEQRPIQAKVTRSDFGPVIVIRRDSKRLFLYKGMRFWRVFRVATGQPSYPTPVGHFAIEVMWRNPWWYPPDSSWAKGAKPIPPGPGNPLGTRWMGLTAPGVGIHGTPDAASIGYSASHGCIRMYIHSAEWLFAHVHIGTPVFIVRA